MVRVGRDLCGSSRPTPCPSRVTQSRLHSTASRRGWNISREGDSTTSLGSLDQGSVTLRGKKFFLIFSWNFLCFSLCPLPLVLKCQVKRDKEPTSLRVGWIPASYSSAKAEALSPAGAVPAVSLLPRDRVFSSLHIEPYTHEDMPLTIFIAQCKTSRLWPILQAAFCYQMWWQALCYQTLFLLPSPVTHFDGFTHL